MLGPRIAALRRGAAMSQCDLAKRLGISPSAVGMYEQGRREPSAQMLVNLSEIFGVSTDYLLTGKSTDTRDEAAFSKMLLHSIEAADKRLENRLQRPFSRQELAVLMAAMLIDP